MQIESGVQPAFLLDPASVRRIGTGTALTVLLFAATATVLQWLRVDLDWVRAPLSAYLTGPYSVWLKASYFLLSCCLVLLGLAYRSAVAAPARSQAPPWLFAAAGVALTVTALTPHQVSAPRHSIHIAAATITFLCITAAMLVQSWCLRRDAAWRHRFGSAFSLAMLSFVGMWAHALWHGGPRGLVQKLVIAGILGWLLLTSLWLRQEPRGRVPAR
jgi:hypothetical protein